MSTPAISRQRARRPSRGARVEPVVRTILGVSFIQSANEGRNPQAARKDCQARLRCLTGAVEANVTPEPSPTSPDERITAIGTAPAIAKPAIPFAA